MSETADKPKRKSVAFAEGTLEVDSDGKVTDGTANGVAEAPSAESHSADVDETADMFASLAVKKKKKSSTKKATEEEGGEEKTETADGELDLSSLKKKKKKKSKVDELAQELAGEDGEEGGAEKKDEEVVVEGDPFKGTGIWQHDQETDIPYTALLSRFFSELTNRHPEIAGGAAKSYKIPPPQCLREGNKKTLLANLPEIYKRLNRSEEHITAFLFAELGTSGSVMGTGGLIIRGRFQSKQIENVLRRYVMDYVICKTCKSPDTTLTRGDNRLTFMSCNSCGSRRSVQAINRGFSAQIGKRKRQQG